MTAALSGIQSIVWTTSGSETIRKPHKVGFIYRIQYCCGRPLNDLVLQCRYTQWPLTAIAFRYVHSFHRFCSVRPTLQPAGQVMKVALQFLPIMPPCLTVHSRGSVPLKPVVRIAECFDVVNMMSKRGKPHPSITFCCLSYPFQRFGQAEQVKLTISDRPSQQSDALGPFEFRHSHLFPGSAPGACLARSDSPWPDPFPPPPPLTGVTPAFVRRSPRYYGSVRLPTSVRRKQILQKPDDTVRIGGVFD